MKANKITVVLLTILILLTSCTAESTEIALPQPTQLSNTVPDTETAKVSPTATEVPPMNQTQFANVLSVQVSGEPGAFQFAVKISSPDTGCEQFADWWEVFSEDGELIYRRILLHSHVDEQPFTRSGGQVDIASDTVVYVRAHMNTSGYGGTAMRGTVRDGFKPVELETGFGSDLEQIPPQPEDCAF